MVASSIQSRIGRWSALAWLAGSSVYLLVLSAVICGNARFPLKLGAIKTTGRTGLWLTLVPALAGFLALGLVLFRIRAGAFILGVYCAFWTAVLASVLPFVWNARQSFCTSTMCIRTPWIGRLLVFGLMTPFAIVALWARREFARLRQTALPK
jgi:hypothetical protein